jgi:hypothetical protein
MTLRRKAYYRCDPVQVLLAGYEGDMCQRAMVHRHQEFGELEWVATRPTRPFGTVIVAVICLECDVPGPWGAGMHGSDVSYCSSSSLSSIVSHFVLSGFPLSVFH